MSQLCGPGSSPFTGPITTGPSISMSGVNAVFTAAGQLFAAITTRVLTWVQQQLEAASTTAGGLSAKVAAPIVAGLNQAEATAAGIQTVVQSSIAGQMAGATMASGTGGSVSSGVQPGQYHYNVYQNIDTPAAVGIYVTGQLPDAAATNNCFMGGFDALPDALAFKSSIQGVPVPARCRSPGGIASGPPPPAPACPAPGWYNVYYNLQDGRPFDCLLQCASDPPPAGRANFQGPFTSQADAQAWVDANCPAPPPPPPPPPAADWYAGCDQTGMATSWETVALEPAGVTGVVGPFADQATALAALTTCVPPPPPPPPPKTGMCCDPTTGAVILPSCIKIDLCDWKPFTDALAEAIYQGLCRWIKDPECACPTHDSDRWIMEDCDGEATKIVEGWAGKIGGSVLGSGGLDGLVSSAAALLTAVGRGGGTIP